MRKSVNFHTFQMCIEQDAAVLADNLLKVLLVNAAFRKEQPRINNPE